MTTVTFYDGSSHDFAALPAATQAYMVAKVIATDFGSGGSVGSRVVARIRKALNKDKPSSVKAEAIKAWRENPANAEQLNAWFDAERRVLLATYLAGKDGDGNELVYAVRDGSGGAVESIEVRAAKATLQYLFANSKPLPTPWPTGPGSKAKIEAYVTAFLADTPTKRHPNGLMTAHRKVFDSYVKAMQAANGAAHDDDEDENGALGAL